MIEEITWVLVAVAIFLGWFVWKSRKVLAAARSLPTVRPTLPVVGHLHHVQSLDELINPFAMGLATKAASEGVNEFCVWQGPVPLVAILNPEDIKVVLNSSKSMERGPEFKLVQCFLGAGLLAGPVKNWRPIRRSLQPLFRPSKLKQLIPILNNRAKHLIADLSAHEGRGPVDVLPLVLPTNLANISRYALGPDTIISPEVMHSFCQSITRTFKVWAMRLFRVWLHWEFMFKIFYWKDYSAIDKANTDFTEPAIQELRRKIAKEKFEEIDSSLNPSTMLDVFVRMMPSHPNLTEDRVRQEVLTICAGGTDTSSIALSSCLLALAMHPSIQDKTYAEIASVLGDCGRDVTLKDLQSMSYLHQVFKETLRRFTIFPFVSREVTEDITLSFGSVPTGTRIHISIYGIHMNPNIYPEPEKFDPDRFAPENVAKRHKLAFLPFATGPRNCLGKDYAMISIKSNLVYILRSFKLSTGVKMEDVKFVYNMELVKENGYPVCLERRL